MSKVISNRPKEVNVSWHISDESTIDKEELSKLVEGLPAYITALSDPHPKVGGYRFNGTKLEVNGTKVPQPKGDFRAVDIKPNRRISVLLGNTREITGVQIDSTWVNFHYKDTIFNIYLDKE